MVESRTSKTALITGGSSGIGRKFADVFGKNGCNLVLIARNLDQLEQAKIDLQQKFPQREVSVISQDLAEANASQKIFQRISSYGISVDILVNNAGFGSHGKLDERPIEEHSDMMETNMMAVMSLTRLFLPGMKERKWGRILNVSSTASFQPTPGRIMYGASKAFVTSFSLGLSQELIGSGVSASLLCPGLTESNFFNRPNMTPPSTPKFLMMSAEDVAEAGYNGLMAGKRMIIPGFINNVHYRAVKLIPQGLLLKIMSSR